MQLIAYALTWLDHRRFQRSARLAARADLPALVERISTLDSWTGADDLSIDAAFAVIVAAEQVLDLIRDTQT